MGLLGNGWEDPQSQAVMALAGGLLQGNFGAGLLGANQAVSEAKANALKQKLVEAQIGNYQSEAEARKLASIKDARQQALIESMFGGAPSAAGAAAPAQQSPGAYVPSIDGMGPTMPFEAKPPAQAGAGSLVDQARAMGIPENAIKADMVFNGGKGISDMLFKRGTPSMKVSNGYAYDENRVGPGYLPQLSTSQDGKTSMVQIGADGLPVVSAPSGALNTYAGYRNVDESTKANFDPMTVTPAGQPPQMTTRGSLVRSPQVSGTARVTPQQQAGRDTDRAQILQTELSTAQGRLNEALRANDPSAAQRARGDIAALQREIGGSRATVGMPLQSPEEALRASEGVKNDSKVDEDISKNARLSRDVVKNIGMAREILKLGPTESGVGSIVDKALGFGGVSTTGGDLAAKLDTLSGWMVANVPRMEGPQSNFDVKNYQTMAGLVGDRQTPISTRLAALDTLQELQSKYSHLNGPSKEGQTANIVNELPKTAPKGARARDTATGDIMRFNGLSWVKEK